MVYSNVKESDHGLLKRTLPDLARTDFSKITSGTFLKVNW
jgi:hypothetical protein